MKVDLRKPEVKVIRLDQTEGGDCFVKDGCLVMATQETESHSMRIMCVDLTDGDVRYLSPETEVVLEHVKVINDN